MERIPNSPDDQADVSAQEAPPRQGARLPRPDAIGRRSSRPTMTRWSRLCAGPSTGAVYSEGSRVEAHRDRVDQALSDRVRVDAVELSIRAHLLALHGAGNREVRSAQGELDGSPPDRPAPP